MCALPGKAIPKMTYYVLSRTLSFYSLTHFHFLLCVAYDVSLHCLKEFAKIKL